MAKAVHPDRFRDVSLHAWMISFFREVYSVDAARAEGIIDSLWMDWARDR
jgi:iron complex transport system substrate-binding protein